MRLFYRCWTGTKHYADFVPADADEMTPVRFHCDCMGSVWDAPAVKAELAKGRRLTMQGALVLALLSPPPRNPVVSMCALESESDGRD